MRKSKEDAPALIPISELPLVARAVEGARPELTQGLEKALELMKLGETFPVTINPDTVITGVADNIRRQGVLSKIVIGHGPKVTETLGKFFRLSGAPLTNANHQQFQNLTRELTEVEANAVRAALQRVFGQSDQVGVAALQNVPAFAPLLQAMSLSRPDFDTNFRAIGIMEKARRKSEGDHRQVAGQGVNLLETMIQTREKVVTVAQLNTLATNLMRDVRTLDANTSVAKLQQLKDQFQQLASTQIDSSHGRADLEEQAAIVEHVAEALIQSGVALVRPNSDHVITVNAYLDARNRIYGGVLAMWVLITSIQRAVQQMLLTSSSELRRQAVSQLAEFAASSAMTVAIQKQMVLENTSKTIIEVGQSNQT